MFEGHLRAQPTKLPARSIAQPACAPRSLREGVERLAFSVIWEVTPAVEVVRANFTKSIIRSRAALTYEQAQTRVDDASQNDEVTASLRLLMQVARMLRKRRCGARRRSIVSCDTASRLYSCAALYLTGVARSRPGHAALLDVPTQLPHRIATFTGLMLAR